MIWINSMLASSMKTPGLNPKVFREMLSSISARELKILIKHKDLIADAMKISGMDKHQLGNKVTTECLLQIEHCTGTCVGDVWIEVDKERAKDFIPDWMTKYWNDKLPYQGWYMTYECDENDFVPWARDLLLQSVRIGIWERYLEYKQEKARRSSASDAGRRIPGGNYL
jgi:hypothetical protein